MGCDIHCYVEKKDCDGNWIAQDEWSKDEEGSLDTPWKESIYNGRNYSVFAILADVRNGYGFAGCDTGREVEPIAMPKGLPDNCCSEIRSCSDQWGCDGHSHSHFTLQELMNHDWTQLQTHRGIVDINDYAKWKAFGDYFPNSWSGDISGPNVRIGLEGPAKTQCKEIYTKYQLARKDITQEHIDRWLDDGDFPFVHGMFKDIDMEILPITHVSAEWTTPHFESAKHFFVPVIPRLLAMSEGDHDSVRIVFWFDN